MNQKFILALDLGTTGNRAIIFNHKQQIVAKAYQEFKQYYPQEGWVEHDPIEIWETTLQVIKKAISEAKISPKDILAAGITNQRETTVIWDKHSGKPVYNAIVWQCRRTASYCESLAKNKKTALQIHQKTGLRLDAYFSATKIRWIFKHVKNSLSKAKAGKLLFGTIDTWILWNLTKGKVHATDYSNASRTLLFNIKTLKWDTQLMNLFKVPQNILPEVKESSGIFGYIDQSILNASIPIAGIAGDQQCAMFSQGCYQPGIIKNTYGTGCFLLMNVGPKPVYSKNKLLTTIAWGINHKVEYALEGSVFMGGASVQWLRDGLKIIKSARDTEKISVKNNGGVYFVPALVGLGAPYWDMKARGTIIGLTRGTNQEHLIRATLEAIAYQSKDMIKAIELDTGTKLQTLKVDGGACANNLLMQFQADILNTKVQRPEIIETTALGAAMLAGLALGFWKNKAELIQKKGINKIFVPQMKKEEQKQLYHNWKKAVERSKNWLE
ncbi:MAG TPA: glycerol kinase GlpK [Candidatus Nanoarchaeia archaeon]|nr:glycerol kinase GlpK [Candidatus Nanoarchaeia archaeon]